VPFIGSSLLLTFLSLIHAYVGAAFTDKGNREGIKRFNVANTIKKIHNTSVIYDWRLLTPHN